MGGVRHEMGLIREEKKIGTVSWKTEKILYYQKSGRQLKDLKEIVEERQNRFVVEGNFELGRSEQRRGWVRMRMELKG